MHKPYDVATQLIAAKETLQELKKQRRKATDHTRFTELDGAIDLATKVVRKIRINLFDLEDYLRAACIFRPAPPYRKGFL